MPFTANLLYSTHWFSTPSLDSLQGITVFLEAWEPSLCTRLDMVQIFVLNWTPKLWTMSLLNYRRSIHNNIIPVTTTFAHCLDMLTLFCTRIHRSMTVFATKNGVPLMLVIVTGASLPIDVTMHFPRFICIAFSTGQANSESESCCSICSSLGGLTSFHTFRSSANSTHFDLKMRGSSITNMINSGRPTTDLCGTPLDIESQVEKSDQTLTHWRRLVRNSSHQASESITRQ